MWMKDASTRSCWTNSQFLVQCLLGLFHAKISQDVRVIVLLHIVLTADLRSLMFFVADCRF